MEGSSQVKRRAGALALKPKGTGMIREQRAGVARTGGQRSWWSEVGEVGKCRPGVGV